VRWLICWLPLCCSVELVLCLSVLLWNYGIVDSFLDIEFVEVSLVYDSFSLLLLSPLVFKQRIVSLTYILYACVKSLQSYDILLYFLTFVLPLTTILLPKLPKTIN